ncbi:MAG: ATP-dependent RecD-like DNA helicase [Ruminococcaceae bacterium]|nr:ATP-dependent RecD-like DNA helicase [Oscillospiraceae bacterium]
MVETELLKITGTVEDVVFHNPETGYIVLELFCDGEGITAVGELGECFEGEELTLHGNFTSHPTFGRQFKAVFCEHRLPSALPEIIRFLSSGAVRGIGEVTAQKLVKYFGADTLTILEEDPGRIFEVPGLSPNRAEKLRANLAKLFDARITMQALSELSLNGSEAVNLFKLYGHLAADVLRENPFVVCCEEVGVSFSRADEIRISLGYPDAAPVRLGAGLLYVFRVCLDSGHTCISRDQLLNLAGSLLSVDLDSIEVELDQKIEDGDIISEILGDKERLFLRRYYESERYISGRIAMLNELPPVFGCDCRTAIGILEEASGMTYAALQRQAIEEALSGGVFVLTGGPGTGKTTTIRAIISILESAGLEVALAAPTGRAAKRMSELTGREAKTIHRMLEVGFSDAAGAIFQRNENNTLKCDAVIIDEMSMVDTLLFEALLKAMRLSCRLILVGDSDQLPSVGAGNILKCLVGSGKVRTVQLTEVFRQAAESLIITNAHRIVRGEYPVLDEKKQDFFFLPAPRSDQAAELVCDLVSRRLPTSYGYSPFWDIQVLCPGRKGELGTFSLNQRLGGILNPPAKQKPELKYGSYTFRLGDKVMQTRNNYDIPWTAGRKDGAGIFNGDIGMIEAIDKHAGTLIVRFDDRVASLSTDHLADLEPAYAITVHKAQGSEFDAVILPLLGGFEKLYYRNLLYTAVTRAKKLLIIVGKRETVFQMVDNNRRMLRYTGLKVFLQEAEKAGIAGAPEPIVILSPDEI